MLSNETDKTNDQLDPVRSLVAPAVRSAGCELWDLVLTGPPGRRLLRVYIDAPGGVDIERCTRVSRTLRPVLDQASVGLADADLEVSSPGAERPLRGVDDYLRSIGERINARFGHGDAEAVVEGILMQVTDDALLVAGREGQANEVPLADLRGVRLAVAFGGDDRPQRRPGRR